MTDRGFDSQPPREPFRHDHGQSVQNQPGDGYFVAPAPPGGTPVTAQPTVSAVRTPAHRTVPPTVKRSTVRVLAVATAVLVATTGLFVTLFVMKQEERKSVDDQVTVVVRTIEDAQRQLESTKTDLAEANARKTDLESRGSSVRKCADPAKEVVAVAGVDDAKLDAAFGRMLISCG